MDGEKIEYSIEELINLPLIDKIKDMHKAILANIEIILKDSENCPYPVEYSRMNGMVYAYAHCKVMMESILRFEEQRCGCGSWIDQENKSTSSTCIDCKRKTLG
jgi:hypothetical protein